MSRDGVYWPSASLVMASRRRTAAPSLHWETDAPQRAVMFPFRKTLQLWTCIPESGPLALAIVPESSILHVYRPP
jgi:hypothetical protein